MARPSTNARVVSKDGTSIAYYKAGAGPAVIAIDGAFSHPAITPAWSRLADLLGQRFAVYSYDRRGRGNSTDTPPYSPEREVEDLAAIIKEAGGSAFVLGHSSGANLALDAAASGLSVLKMVLYEPPLIVDATRPSAPKDYASHITALLSSGHREEAIEYFWTAGVGIPPHMVAQMKSSPMFPPLVAVADTLIYDVTITEKFLFGQPLPRGQWASVRIPTLVIDGGASPAWIRNGAQALVDILPNAKRRTLEGQAHGIDASVVAPVLEEFFRKG